MKRVARVDHVQIAAPEGCERAAREFYGSILGLQEIKKPLVLRTRGGCWFQCDQQQVHIGVEPGFRPAKKAHPAFVVYSLDELPFSPAASMLLTVRICPRGVVSLPTILGATGSNLSKCRGSLLARRVPANFLQPNTIQKPHCA